MPKLTKRFVEGVKPVEKDVVIFDSIMPGFGLRVMASGIRSYCVQYRNAQGRSRRFTIGKHGKWTPERARSTARKVLDAVNSGKDPVAERRAYLDAPTVNDLLDRYLAEHVERRNRPRTCVEVKRLVERHIRLQLGRLKVAAVIRQDVAKLHHSLADTPRQANFVLAVCSKAFSLAELWGMRPDGSNPCKRIGRNPENARERFLSDDELSRLGATLRCAESEGLTWNVKVKGPNAKHLAKPENRRTVYPRAVTAAVELLLYTGCRLSEILGLQWDQIDIQTNTIILRETKAGRPQVVVLNAPARQVLNSLPRMQGSPWVLPMHTNPTRPFSKDTLEGAWQRIREAAGLADVRLHDLRHTFGTYAGHSNANAFQVRDLLRHRHISMSSRYVNRADDPVRALSNLVGKRIESGLVGRKPAKVVSLQRP